MSGSRGRKYDEKGQVGPFLTLPLSIDCGQTVPCLGSTRGAFVLGIPPEGLSGVVQQLGPRLASLGSGGQRSCG